MTVVGGAYFDSKFFSFILNPNLRLEKKTQTSVEQIHHLL